MPAYQNIIIIQGKLLPRWHIWSIYVYTYSFFTRLIYLSVTVFGEFTLECEVFQWIISRLYRTWVSKVMIFKTKISVGFGVNFVFHFFTDGHRSFNVFFVVKLICDFRFFLSLKTPSMTTGGQYCWNSRRNIKNYINTIFVFNFPSIVSYHFCSIKSGLRKTAKMAPFVNINIHNFHLISEMFTIYLPFYIARKGGRGGKRGDWKRKRGWNRERKRGGEIGKGKVCKHL